MTLYANWVHNVVALNITNKTNALKAGETYNLKTIFSPNEATNKKVNWTSSDTNIATVDSNGTVKAIGRWP